MGGSATLKISSTTCIFDGVFVAYASNLSYAAHAFQVLNGNDAIPRQVKPAQVAASEQTIDLLDAMIGEQNLKDDLWIKLTCCKLQIL